MDDAIKKRLTWIKLYEETGDAGLVCRRCGISRPTLRKWLRRYKEQGEAGLSDHSRRPQHSPNRKVFERETQWILELRRTRHEEVYSRFDEDRERAYKRRQQLNQHFKECNKV